MKVILLGYMGSGKSTIGRLISENRILHLLDLDDEIEKIRNTTIPKIFEEKGNIGFRKIEASSLRKVIEENQEQLLLSLEVVRLAMLETWNISTSKRMLLPCIYNFPCLVL